MSAEQSRRISPEKCGEHFHGTVMAPLAYPAVGWEPVMETDNCEREKGHEGSHQGERIEWKDAA